ncbi:MAG: T9SS type A sorting domain-containing protein [Salibacteraceae bacterium]
MRFNTIKKTFAYSTFSLRLRISTILSTGLIILCSQFCFGQLSSITASFAGHSPSGSNNIITVDDCSPLAGERLTLDVNFTIDQSELELSGSNKLTVELEHKLLGSSFGWTSHGNWSGANDDWIFVDNNSSSTNCSAVQNIDMTATSIPITAVVAHGNETQSREFRLKFKLETSSTAGECNPINSSVEYNYQFEIHHTYYQPGSPSVQLLDSEPATSGGQGHFLVCPYTNLRFIGFAPEVDEGCVGRYEWQLEELDEDFESYDPPTITVEYNETFVNDQNPSDTLIAFVPLSNQIMPSTNYKWTLRYEAQNNGEYSTYLRGKEYASISGTQNAETCEGTNITLTANGSGTLSWWQGSTFLTNGSTYTVNSPSQNQTFKVTSDEICVNSLNIPLTVHPTPQVSINSNLQFCEVDFPVDFNNEVTVTLNNETTDPDNFDWPQLCGFSTTTAGEFDPISANCYSGTPTSHSYNTQLKYTSNEGCESDWVSFQFAWNDDPAVNATITDALCYGSADGQVVIDPEGDDPITVYWNDLTGNFNNPEPYSSSTYSFGNLTAGNYVIDLFDEDDCHTQETVAVVEPDELIVSSISAGNISHPTCVYQNVNWNSSPWNANIEFSESGSGTEIWGGADVSWSGGNSPYDIQVNPSPSNPFDQSWTSSISSTSSPATAYPMIAGTYSVRIVDDNGCTSSNTSSLVLSPVVDMDMSVSTTMADCPGVNNGTISTTVDNLNGTGTASPYSYLWSNNQTSANLNSAGGGSNYDVTVTSVQGCYLIKEDINVGYVNANPFYVNIDNIILPDCDGAANGQLSALPNGMTYEWSNGETSQMITDLTNGTYYVTVEDASGCRIQNSEVLPGEGAEFWQQHSDNDTDLEDHAVAVVSDENDNVYILGTFKETTTIGSTNIDTEQNSITGFYVAKFNSCGEEEWVTHSVFEDQDNPDITPIDLVLDGTNLYVALHFHGQNYSYLKLRTLPGTGSSNIGTSNLKYTQIFKLGTSDGQPVNSLTYGSDFYGSNASNIATGGDRLYDMKFNSGSLFLSGKDDDEAIVYEVVFNSSFSSVLSNSSSNTGNEFVELEFSDSYVYVIGNTTSGVEFNTNTFTPTHTQEAFILKTSQTNLGSVTDVSAVYQGATTASGLEFEPGSDHPFVGVNSDLDFHIISKKFDLASNFWVLNSDLTHATEASISDLSWDDDASKIIAVGDFKGQTLQVLSNSANASTGGSNSSLSDLWISGVEPVNGVAEWLISAYNNGTGTSGITPTSVSSAGANNYVVGDFGNSMRFYSSSEADLQHPNETELSMFAFRFGNAYSPSGPAEFYKTGSDPKETNEPSNASFSIYPNPNNGILSITFPSIKVNYRLRVVNLHGQVVFSSDVNGKAGKHELDMTKLPAGVYQVELFNNFESLTSRVVKL